MDRFLSCDWGTSSFRLRLIQADTHAVLAEETSNEGIAVIHQQWLKENGKEDERSVFYQSFLRKQIDKLKEKSGVNADGLPLVLSGMASSSIGMMELPYKVLPFKADGSDIESVIIEASDQFPHQLIVISGGRTDNDVLRGEETLLIGCDVKTQHKDSVFIFPGTHSKHIHVTQGEAKSFKTYMTGELFALLSQKSILANSVEKDDAPIEEVHAFFEKGIIEGASGNLLNVLFHVRTAHLLKRKTAKENYHYLSGLLIGAELKDLVQTPPQLLFLVSGKDLLEQYKHGLIILGLFKNAVIINANEALVRGQWHIYQQIKATLGKEIKELISDPSQ